MNTHSSLPSTWLILLLRWFALACQSPSRLAFWLIAPVATKPGVDLGLPRLDTSLALQHRARFWPIALSHHASNRDRYLGFAGQIRVSRDHLSGCRVSEHVLWLPSCVMAVGKCVVRGLATIQRKNLIPKRRVAHGEQIALPAVCRRQFGGRLGNSRALVVRVVARNAG